MSTTEHWAISGWSYGGTDPENADWVYIIQADPNPDGTHTIVGWATGRLALQMIREHNELLGRPGPGCGDACLD